MMISSFPKYHCAFLDSIYDFTLPTEDPLLGAKRQLATLNSLLTPPRPLHCPTLPRHTSKLSATTSTPIIVTAAKPIRFTVTPDRPLPMLRDGRSAASSA